MLKPLLIGLGIAAVIIVVLLALAGWWLYRVMTGPMYVPGSLAARAAAFEPPAQDDRSDVWTVAPGIQLAYHVSGAGRPVLFVHGGPGHPQREPLPWLEALGNGHSIVQYDQRGCGGSTRPFDRFASSKSSSFYPNLKLLESTLGVGAQLADIERIRRLLGEERLLLVGHSFGAFLATLYATEFPERVERLVLLAPADMLVMPVEHDGLFGLVRDRLPAERREAYEVFLEEYLDFRNLFVHDEDELALRHLQLATYIMEAMGRPAPALPAPGTRSESGGWMPYALYFSLGKRHDYREALSRITAPTLVVHAGRDLQPLSVAEGYVGLIPDAELLRIGDADHFLDGPLPELRDRVRGFLDGASAR